MTVSTPPADHPDRTTWNRRYAARPARFQVHPLVTAALAAGTPPGPVLELAAGESGGALALAAAGRAVTAVDIADIALDRLAAQARQRGLADRLTVVHADLTTMPPPVGRYAIVVCIRYWDRSVFPLACTAVLPGGLLAWEVVTAIGGGPPPLRWRPAADSEPRSLLPTGWHVLVEHDTSSGGHATRQLLARRPANGRADHGQPHQEDADDHRKR